MFPSYKNMANQLTDLYMMETLAFKGLTYSMSQYLIYFNFQELCSFFTLKALKKLWLFYISEGLEGVE